MNLQLVVGLLVMGVCLFAAGWVMRTLADQALRRRRGRLARRRWNRDRRRGGTIGSLSR